MNHTNSDKVLTLIKQYQLQSLELKDIQALSEDQSSHVIVTNSIGNRKVARTFSDDMNTKKKITKFLEDRVRQDLAATIVQLKALGVIVDADVPDPTK